MPESKWPMITVDEALAIVLRHTTPLTPVETPLMGALGRILAVDIYAQEDMPPFPASAVDGYAVIASDTQTQREMIGDQTAGMMGDFVVRPGTVARITTGAPVPHGADAIVMVERTEERNGTVFIHQTDVKPGAHIRPVGQDIARGDLVLRAGHLLGPAELGVLATLGHSQAPVYPAPRVAVLSTGDELVEPGEPLGPGRIRDSNRYTLMAAVAQAGGIPLDLGIARDEANDLEARVRRGLAEADVFISSGGVSMGQLDLVKPLLEELGTVHFGRIYMKPGKPLTFATIGPKLAFALPGNPVSSLVSLELFVRPALRKLQGYVNTARPTHPVRLAHAVRHDEDRTEYQRAIVRRDGDGYVASTTGFQGSGRLMSMVGANALIVLPFGRGNFAAGEEVQAMLLDQSILI